MAMRVYLGSKGVDKGEGVKGAEAPPSPPVFEIHPIAVHDHLLLPMCIPAPTLIYAIGQYGVAISGAQAQAYINPQVVLYSARVPARVSR